MPSGIEKAMQAADAFYARSDAVATGAWGKVEPSRSDAQITSGSYSKANPGDKITQEWSGGAWKTVDPKSPAKGPRETQTWDGKQWN